MKKMLPVLSAHLDHHHLFLNVSEELSLSNIIAKEQMLVDSNAFSFIYILEIDGEYTYLVIHEDLWPILKDAKEKTVVLSNQKEILPLPMFNEELTYLIENIKGNSNYGEEMVGKVESTF